jgi:hypothetical protein
VLSRIRPCPIPSELTSDHWPFTDFWYRPRASERSANWSGTASADRNSSMQGVTQPVTFGTTCDARFVHAILHSVRSEALSNSWKLRVISVANGSAQVVLNWLMVSSMAALKAAKLGWYLP